MDHHEGRTRMAAASGPRGNRAPGLPVAAAIVVATAAFGILGASRLLDRELAPSANGNEMEEVTDADRVAALTASGLRDSDVERAAERLRQCKQHLAFVTVLPAQPGAAAKIRIRSGTWVSPEFEASVGPVRVSVPYPAPYEAGQGVLTLLHDGAPAVVSLRPGIALPAGPVTESRTVSWAPRKDCPGANG